jgi:hypothetical protein
MPQRWVAEALNPVVVGGNDRDPAAPGRPQITADELRGQVRTTEMTENRRGRIDPVVYATAADS